MADGKELSADLLHGRGGVETLKLCKATGAHPTHGPVARGAREPSTNFAGRSS